MRPVVLLPAALLVLLPVDASRAGARRPYSLSVEVAYGREVSRASYRDEVEDALAVWLATTGPRDAPHEKGEADLHLRVVLLRIEVDPDRGGGTGAPGVFGDMGGNARSSAGYSTRFVVEAAVLDPRDDAVVAKKKLTVYSRATPADNQPDARREAFEENVAFLKKRLAGFLDAKERRILTYLEKARAGESPTD